MTIASTTTEAALATRAANRRGILAMLAAMCGFICNDTLIKLAGETMPLGEIILTRGIMALILMAALTTMMGAWRKFPAGTARPLGLRVIGELGATLFYLTALLSMPLANATAILQGMPLVMTVLAAFYLKEQVGWRRWVAVLIGFVGMLLVVQPGLSGFDTSAPIAVAALGFVALRDLSNRFIPAAAPTILVAMTTMTAVTIAGAVMVAIDGYGGLPTSRELAILACAAVFLTLAFYFITDAMRSGELSVVAPFRYSIIVWAIILGFLVWGDVPGPLRTFGIFLIVGSGLFIFYRERMRQRKLDAAMRSGLPQTSDASR
ncbi:DMT family transporter [Tepidamorphus sp. 3E244]|uniref:DMT family transporter n=1 Tax=Tepidamorphus sp. 3E244 TaxID=3385498 RepID=UPI0038FC37FD